jgi:predicted DNA-binding transcriptional regulator AlpA
MNNDDSHVRPGERLLNRRQLLDKTGLSYVKIWQMTQAGAFPRARVIDSRSLWIESEIDEWIANLPRRRLKNHGDGVAYCREGTLT